MRLPSPSVTLFVSLVILAMPVGAVAAPAVDAGGGNSSGGAAGIGSGNSSGSAGTSVGSGNTSSGGGSGLSNPLTSNSLSELLTKILGFVKTIGGIVVVLMLVYVGFLFVTAQGNEEKIRSARDALFWTVIGALILLGATAIQAGIAATVQNL